MATYSSNKNCRSKSHSSTVGNSKYINYAKLVNPKATRPAASYYMFRKTFWLRTFSVTNDKVSDSDCQLDLDAVIELAYSGEESESEVRNTVFQKL
jgi:hypothetical protein